MINFGIYFETVHDGELLKNAIDGIENSLKEKKIRDASIFYDQISTVTSKCPCGLFHSSDLWNFSGCLFVMSSTSTQKIKNIANNIKMYMGYGWHSRNVLSTLQAISDNKTKVIAYSEDTAADFYRISSCKPVGISPSFNELIDIIVREEDER